MAEAEAHALLRAAKTQCELAQQALERTSRQCLEFAQSLQQARTSARTTLIGLKSAAQLAQAADGLLYGAAKLRAFQDAVTRATAEVAAWGRTLEQRRTQWLSARARREAAELYESLERREQRRIRAQREHLHEAEAGARFALFRVK